jgi:hypothetical protein
MIDGDDCGAISEMNDWQGKPKYVEEAWPSAALSTTNPTWLYSGSNLCCRSGKPTSNRLSYGTVAVTAITLTLITESWLWNVWTLHAHILTLGTSGRKVLLGWTLSQTCTECVEEYTARSICCYLSRMVGWSQRSACIGKWFIFHERYDKFLNCYWSHRHLSTAISKVHMS